MRVMPILGLILNMRNRDRDPPLLLLRSLIDLINAVNDVFAFRSDNTFVIAAVNVVFPWSI